MHFYLDSSFPGKVPKSLENGSISDGYLKVDGTSIHVIQVGKKSKVPILLLHGAAFSAETWSKLNTLTELQMAGFFAIAIDLPGFGESENLKNNEDLDIFVFKLIQTLGINKPVIISPSYSGAYSVPFVLKHGDKVAGYIPIAPSISSQYTSQAFENVKVPTLIIYGEKDGGGKRSSQILSKIPNSRVEVIPNGRHPAYLDNPKLFHKLVIEFVNDLK